MMVSYSQVLILAGLLFTLGFFCTVARRNLVMMLLGVEIMLNAAMVALIGAALRWQNMEGQALVLFIFAVAAAEVSVGLAFIVCLHRGKGSLDPDQYHLLR